MTRYNLRSSNGTRPQGQVTVSRKRRASTRATKKSTNCTPRDTNLAEKCYASIPCTTEDQIIRRKYLENEPLVVVFNERRALCRRCLLNVKLCNKNVYDLYHWQKHRKRCLRLLKEDGIPMKRVKSVAKQRKLKNSSHWQTVVSVLAHTYEDVFAIPSEAPQEEEEDVPMEGTSRPTSPSLSVNVDELSDPTPGSPTPSLIEDMDELSDATPEPSTPFPATDAYDISNATPSSPTPDTHMPLEVRESQTRSPTHSTSSETHLISYTPFEASIAKLPHITHQDSESKDRRDLTALLLIASEVLESYPLRPAQWPELAGKAGDDEVEEERGDLDTDMDWI